MKEGFESKFLGLIILVLGGGMVVAIGLTMIGNQQAIDNLSERIELAKQNPPSPTQGF